MKIKGPNTNIWGEPQIGENTEIAGFVEIGSTKEHPTTIGDNCMIQAFAFIPPGITVGNGVFIAPHVCFTNDRYPPSYGRHWAPIVVKDHAVIGANATILPGVTIGVSAMVAAGAVVTEDVPDHSIVMNTAVVQGPPVNMPGYGVVRYEYYTGSVVARRKGTRKQP